MSCVWSVKCNRERLASPLCNECQMAACDWWLCTLLRLQRYLQYCKTVRFFEIGIKTWRTTNILVAVNFKNSRKMKKYCKGCSMKPFMEYTKECPMECPISEIKNLGKVTVWKNCLENPNWKKYLPKWFLGFLHQNKKYYTRLFYMREHPL